MRERNIDKPNWFTKTSGNKVSVVSRLVAGGPLFFFGLMKLFSEATQANFLATLKLASIPVPEVSMWIAAAVEVVAGALLLAGLYGRLGALLATFQMLVAGYVHLTVDFSQAPAGGPPHWLPLLVLAGALLVLRLGSGSFSWDLRKLREEQ